MRGLRYPLIGILPALLFSQSALADGNEQLVERFFTACPVSMDTAAPLHAAAKRYSWRPLSPAELDTELRTNSEFMLDGYLPAVLRTIRDRKVADELIAKERDRQNARKAVGFTSRNEDIAALNFEQTDFILPTRELMCIVQTASPVDVVGVVAKVSGRLGVQPTKWKGDYDSWSWEVDPSRALAPIISLVNGGRHYEGRIVLILQVYLGKDREMKLFFTETQLAHQPKQYMVHGRIVDPFENPNRATTLINSLEGAGLQRAEPKDYGRDAISKVHADHYVAFLEEAYARFTELPNHGPEVLPNVHPYRGASLSYADRGPPRVTGIIGRAGWYMGDMSCATMEGTFRAAYASAQTAIAGAEDILAGAKSTFSLCRPPGHHAYADRCSGFCYLNNAAIAAEVLRRKVQRVAIIDFDTHHGDGTQAIFYARGDVFYGSVHTDPSAYYPHFAGYADETGAGDGAGANLNLPLPFGADDAAFVAANARLCDATKAFAADALVLSAGWDAHRDDPLSKLAVSTDAYARIGELYGRLGLPTLVVQEGGYSLEAVAAASRAFMQAFRELHG